MSTSQSFLRNVRNKTKDKRHSEYFGIYLSLNVILEQHWCNKKQALRSSCELLRTKDSKRKEPYGTLRILQESSGTFRHIQDSSGTFRHVQEPLGTFRNLEQPSGTFRQVQALPFELPLKLPPQLPLNYS